MSIYLYFIYISLHHSINANHKLETSANIKYAWPCVQVVKHDMQNYKHSYYLDRGYPLKMLFTSDLYTSFSSFLFCRKLALFRSQYRHS